MQYFRQLQDAVVWFGLAFLVLALPTCARGTAPGNAANSPDSVPAPMARVTGNPFAGAEFFVPTYTNADQARRRWLQTDPAKAALLAKIADTPQARWFGGWSGDIQIVVNNYVRAAHNKGKAALLVAYNIPNRDCGLYSAGGAGDAESYRKWIRDYAAGIGDQRRAIVVLEPDALGHLEDCLSASDQAVRLELLKFAVSELQARPGVSVYLDAGHARWMKPAEAAKRLRQAGVGAARGFALNVSNYIANAELIEYGEAISALLDGAHFIVDSSRNGRGPTEDAAWCNPAGRALGRRPSASSESGPLDAFAWIKSPGESDGTCEGGPKAGDWFEERALEMAKSADW